MINRLDYTWLQRIRRLRPEERITRLRNFAWLVTGIYQSRSVHLSKMAAKIPGSAKLVSLTRRLSRFLDNPAIRVPVARRLLPCVAQSGGEIRLIADGTRVLLMGAIAFRRRAIPIAWTWSRVSKGIAPPSNNRPSWPPCTLGSLLASRFCFSATANLAL